MPDYANGKIYKIVGEDGSTYYGSTTQKYISARLGQHKYKKMTAYKEIISKMKHEIILVENCPCDSKEILEGREAYYIRNFPCVNTDIPGRTVQEYYQDNKGKIKDRTRKYRIDNLEKCKETHDKYREKHRDKLCAQKRNRYHWEVSFGDDRKTNCLQRCDPSLFQ